MKLQIDVETDVVDKLREIAESKLPVARAEFVDATLRACLEETIPDTPVDTGRTRAAWEMALQRQQSEDASVAENESANASERTATNSVPYVGYLEYGTSKMPPFAMLRGALLRVSRRLSEFFHLT